MPNRDLKARVADLAPVNETVVKNGLRAAVAAITPQSVTQPAVLPINAGIAEQTQDDNPSHQQ